MKIEEEAKDCIADELQPDLYVINKDLMQYVDKNEGDDRATKNDPRSVKALVTNHTIDKTLDYDRMQTRSRKASIVVMPTVTEMIDCD